MPIRSRTSSPGKAGRRTGAASRRKVEPDASWGWSHVRRASGRREVHMVDVSSKPATQREALAEALVRFPPGLLDRLLAGRGPKGPILETARLAGIQAAKRTAELIPLCHALALDGVDVAFRRQGRRELVVRARVACTGRTGVEMEALTAAALAALAIYDMSKALSHEIEISGLRLLEKRGGRSGLWKRPAAGRPAPKP